MDSPSWRCTWLMAYEQREPPFLQLHPFSNQITRYIVCLTFGRTNWPDQKQERKRYSKCGSCGSPSWFPYCSMFISEKRYQGLNGSIFAMQGKHLSPQQCLMSFSSSGTHDSRSCRKVAPLREHGTPDDSEISTETLAQFSLLAIVIWASFKDGAKPAPTTLTQITDAFAVMLQTYEDLWSKAKIER